MASSAAPRRSIPRPRYRRIILERQELRCSIGAHDFERRAPQRVTVDAELLLGMDSAPSRDDLSDTLDYDLLRDGIRAIASDGHYELQETLASRIFNFLAELPGVLGVRVRTGKPDVYEDVATVCYELSSD